MKITLLTTFIISSFSFQINRNPIYNNYSPKMISNNVEILKSVNDIGSEWTYNEFINSINNKNIQTVTF